MNRLEGKVAIITGANSGVGQATAEMFAQEGAKVVLAARRVEPLNDVASKIKELGGDVLIVPTDISKEDDVNNLVKKTMETFGKLDILVNNAGILDKDLNGIAKFETDDFDKVIGINTKGTMMCVKAALQEMKEGSSIVNVASVAGVFGTGGAVYVASKAALIGMTKHTAMVYAKSKIRCNTICPGSIITPMTMTIDRSKLDMNVMTSMNAHNDLSVGYCKASDVASIALFLASDESAAITGQAIVSDFGATL